MCLEDIPLIAQLTVQRCEAQLAFGSPPNIYFFILGKVEVMVLLVYYFYYLKICFLREELSSYKHKNDTSNLINLLVSFMCGSCRLESISTENKMNEFVLSVPRSCRQVPGRDVSALHFTKRKTTEQGHSPSQKNR